MRKAVKRRQRMRGDILRAPPVAAGRGRGGLKRGRAGGGAGRPVPDTARRARCALPPPAPPFPAPRRTCARRAARAAPRGAQAVGPPRQVAPSPLPQAARPGPAGGGGRRRRGLGCRWRPRPSPGRCRGRWGLAAGWCAGALVRALPGGVGDVPAACGLG